jgi:hypothetical protein
MSSSSSMPNDDAVPIFIAVDDIDGDDGPILTEDPTLPPLMVLPLLAAEAVVALGQREYEVGPGDGKGR